MATERHVVIPCCRSPVIEKPPSLTLTANPRPKYALLFPQVLGDEGPRARRRRLSRNDGFC